VISYDSELSTQALEEFRSELGALILDGHPSRVFINLKIISVVSSASSVFKGVTEKQINTDQYVLEVLLATYT
jgi:hypothetical protein